MSTVTNTVGYLEYDYLTRDYLQGLVETADGLQFQARIEDARAPVALQTTYQIVAGASVGLQFQGLIETAYGVGAQFEAKTSAETLAGMQFEGLITTEYPAALQLENKIETDQSAGFQFQAKRVEAYAAGVQWQAAVEATSPTGLEQIAAKGWIHYKCGPGYLEEFPYLTEWDYLVPRICVHGGLQFEGRGERTAEIGLQFQGKIYETLIPGLQFQGKIYEVAPISAQFVAKRIEQQPVGLQFQAKIFESLANGFQFQGKIYETLPIGLQCEAITLKPVGMQVRVALYNSTNLRILCEFPSRGETGNNWTTISTAPSSTNAFNVNNLNTDIVEQVWRSNSATSVTLTCDTQRTGGVFVDTIAILNHNLSGGAEVEVQYSDNNITYNPYANMLVEPENMYYISPDLPLTPHRYWRFVINDPGSSGVQIGTIVFGSAIIFQGECFVDTVRFGKRQFKDQVFTEGHTNVANDRGKKRFLGLEFTDLNFGLANFRQLREVFDDAGTILKCLWIPTPQTASRFAVFGKLEEIPEETHNTRGDDYVSLSLRVDESL